MKKLYRFFLNRPIKQKLLFMSITIILTMLLILGIGSYGLSKKLLSDSSVKASQVLVEQLGQNLDSNITIFEDYILKETFESELYQIMNHEGSENMYRSAYARKRYIKEFSYNLMNYNKNIKAVLLQDNGGSRYVNSLDGWSPTEKELEECMAFDKAYGMWGKTCWIDYNDEMVFASRAVFDRNTMERIGVISVGVDVQFFKEQYRNIDNNPESEILILNQDSRVLIKSSSQAARIAALILDKYSLEELQKKDFYYGKNQFISTIWNASGSQIYVLNLLNMQVISDSAVRLLMPMWYAAAAALLIAFLLAFLISRGISANIRLLLERTKSMSGGDFYTEIQPVTCDEIGMLALEFNEMSRKVRNLLEEISEEKVQKKTAQLKALEFQYDALQAKLNPHFLYNTLESINSLAKINGDQEVADCIYLLGGYLRETISSKKKMVKLCEEIENIKNYIKIQQISYGDKIKVAYELDEILMDASVPKLILQPLVENAIVHGIEPKIGAGHIWISTTCIGKDMQIEIRDDGVGMRALPDKKINHTKVGVMAVQKRIQILYGEEYGITVQSREMQGTCVHVKLPVRFDEEVLEDEI